MKKSKISKWKERSSFTGVLAIVFLIAVMFIAMAIWLFQTLQSTFSLRTAVIIYLIAAVVVVIIWRFRNE